VPAVPRPVLQFSDHFTSNKVSQVERTVLSFASENPIRGRIRDRLSVVIQNVLQRRNDRNSVFARFRFWVRDVCTPHRPLNFQGLTVVVVPLQSSDFAFTQASQCRYRHDRRRSTWQSGDHRKSLFKRISVSVGFCSPAFNLCSLDRVALDQILLHRVGKHGAHSCLDSLQCLVMQIVLTVDIVKQPLDILRGHVPQSDFPNAALEMILEIVFIKFEQ